APHGKQPARWRGVSALSALAALCRLGQRRRGFGPAGRGRCRARLWGADRRLLCDDRAGAAGPEGNYRRRRANRPAEDHAARLAPRAVRRNLRRGVRLSPLAGRLATRRDWTTPNLYERGLVTAAKRSGPSTRTRVARSA